jgi:hypothetical protein
MEKGWGLAYAIIFLLDALYTYVENVCQGTQIVEVKNVALPHLHTMQFSQILPLKNTEKCEAAMDSV